jgi:hypothetical protein
MKRIFASLAIAAFAFMAVPAMSANLLQVNASQLIDVLVNDYNFKTIDILGFKVIDRETDGTVVVQVTTKTGDYTIRYVNNNHPSDDNVCQQKYGSYHWSPTGDVRDCIFGGIDLHVSTIVETQPTFRTDNINKDVCVYETKTRTKPNPGPNGYAIVYNSTTSDGAC